MKSAIFMVTKECNQKCMFCLNSFKDDKELSFEGKKKVIDKLKENNIEVLVLSGGEPFAYDKIIELIDYASDLKIIVQTNGVLLNEELLRKIKGKVILEIALEGMEKEHNFLVGKLNFRKVVENIKLAKRLGIEVFTNFTITKLNINCLEDYVELLKELEINVANFTPLYLCGKALENKNLLLPSKKEYEKFLDKLSELEDGIILNVQAGFKKEMLENVKNHCSCSIGKEITIIPTGGIRLCPSFNEDWGNVLTSDLGIFNDVKPEDGCLVNSLMEAKCTSCIQG